MGVRTETLTAPRVAHEITVASIPENHPYVRHLSAPDGRPVVRRLPDPPPAADYPSPGQWWPPTMLEPGWVADRHDEFDVMHLHFGFDDAHPTALREWTGMLRTHRIPLVMTVHDLVNPHFADPARHLAQLDVLIPAAAELITLTRAAAGEIERRWGRDAVVIPHPHVVPAVRSTLPRPAHPGFVIGVHAKSLRANIDPTPVLAALLAAMPSMPNAVLQLDVHPDVTDPGNDDERAAALRTFLTAATRHSQFRLAVHPRLTDPELWDYLQSIDLCVLPYRFGTHSGWLEACVDLGTAVLVPNTGCYADQHGHPSYGPTADDLAEAVRAIYAQPVSARPDRPDRRRQRQQIAAAHEHVYRRVLTSGR